MLSRTSNLYGMLTTDDPFQYLGGIGAAVRHLDGKAPELYISNLRGVGPNAGAGKIEGAEALSRAEEFATDIQVAGAECDVKDAKLRAVVQRVEELTDVLTRLEGQATVAMDRLEALTFDPIEHISALSETIELVRGVQGVAQARLINERGDLSKQSEILRVRYREMNGDSSDG